MISSLSYAALLISYRISVLVFEARGSEMVEKDSAPLRNTNALAAAASACHLIG